MRLLFHFFIILAIVFGFLAFFLWKEYDETHNAPCVAFTFYRVENVPARCLKHFTEGK